VGQASSSLGSDGRFGRCRRAQCLTGFAQCKEGLSALLVHLPVKVGYRLGRDRLLGPVHEPPFDASAPIHQPLRQDGAELGHGLDAVRADVPGRVDAIGGQSGQPAGPDPLDPRTFDEMGFQVSTPLGGLLAGLQLLELARPPGRQLTPRLSRARCLLPGGARMGIRASLVELLTGSDGDLVRSPLGSYQRPAPRRPSACAAGEPSGS
jgi:hypothetical protein